jgi:hypothetical protein
VYTGKANNDYFYVEKRESISHLHFGVCPARYLNNHIVHILGVVGVQGDVVHRRHQRSGIISWSDMNEEN